MHAAQTIPHADEEMDRRSGLEFSIYRMLDLLDEAKMAQLLELLHDNQALNNLFDRLQLVNGGHV